ncbi:MAG: hypothetical protein ABSF60_07650 [Verrucomicrobiota bacterium]|jgi:hypothetical protein
MKAADATDVPHVNPLELLAFQSLHFLGVMFFAPCGQKHSPAIPICQSDLNHG